MVKASRGSGHHSEKSSVFTYELKGYMYARNLSQVLLDHDPKRINWTRDVILEAG